MGCPFWIYTLFTISHLMTCKSSHFWAGHMTCSWTFWSIFIITSAADQIWTEGRTYLSKIPTISSNPHTIMLLLIVGEFEYPEVQNSPTWCLEGRAPWSGPRHTIPSSKWISSHSYTCHASTNQTPVAPESNVQSQGPCSTSPITPYSLPPPTSSSEYTWIKPSISKCMPTTH